MSTRTTHKSAITEKVSDVVADVQAEKVTATQTTEESQATPDDSTAYHAEQTTAEASESASALDAINRGAASAKEAVGRVIPGVGKAVRKSVYGTFYYASFGVVFAALSVARLVPTNNVMGEALKDGADAARRAVENADAGSPEPSVAVPA